MAWQLSESDLKAPLVKKKKKIKVVCCSIVLHFCIRNCFGPLNLLHPLYWDIRYSVYLHLIIGTFIAMIAKNVRVMKTLWTMSALSSLTVLLWMISRTSISPWLMMVKLVMLAVAPKLRYFPPFTLLLYSYFISLDLLLSMYVQGLSVSKHFLKCLK